MKRIVSLVLVCCLLMGVAIADGQRLNVSGTGTIAMQADRVRAALGINIQGQDLAEVQTRANETINAICTALIEAGLNEKNISTNYIYINPRYDYTGNVERMVGYTINNSLMITTDEIDKIGEYIDVAFSAGANSFDSLEFYVGDDTDAYKQALEIAVKDAMDKAQTIANASGQKLGEIKEISEGNQQDYYNMRSGNRFMLATKEMDAAAGTTVRASQVSVTANVQISYEVGD